MTVRSAVKVSNGVDARWILLLATLVLMFGSAMASAAGYTTDCGKQTASLVAANAEESTLSISVVDLTEEAAADLSELKSDTASAGESSTSAPVLFLGARVASIARDVFGDEQPADSAIQPSAAITPLAKSGDDDAVQDGKADMQDFPMDDRPYSPLRIHREMYRTDI